MAEEKRPSFADRFKPTKSEGMANAGSRGSMLDKLGIKKKEGPAVDPALLRKKPTSEGSSDADASGGNAANQKDKIIARKGLVGSGSFKDNLESSRSDLVYLVKGKDRGRDAWHYVFVDKMKKDQFLKDAKKGELDVAQYGKVLFSGWGTSPPDEIVQQVKERFNIQ